MSRNYANNHPGHSWDEHKMSERQKEITSYNRSWFWGGTEDQTFLMRRLLERIHYLEDTVEELKRKMLEQ
jgi:hypothetical protein